jgi:hypothetical protein
LQKKAEREYLIWFLAAMSAYVLTVLFSSWLIPQMDKEDNLRYAVAILPVLPSLFALSAFMRYLRRMDEMQRRIQLEAISFSFGLTAIITLTSSLLVRAGVSPIPISCIFPMMSAFWGVGVGIASHRYQ